MSVNSRHQFIGEISGLRARGGGGDIGIGIILLETGLKMMPIPQINEHLLLVSGLFVSTPYMTTQSVPTCGTPSLPECSEVCLSRATAGNNVKCVVGPV